MAAKQSVRLTGLGQDSFDACAIAILELQQVLAAQLPPGSMSKFVPGKDSGYLTLEFSNRYFTVDTDHQLDAADLNPYIDPLNILGNRALANARHTSDNEVLYFERQ